MNLRPGAFITHDVIAKTMPYKAKSIAIIAQGGTHLVPKKLATPADTEKAFPTSCNAKKMIAFVQERVFCDIVAVGITDTDVKSYKSAIDLILADNTAYLIVTDFESEELIAYANSQIKTLAKDKLFISGCESQLDVPTFAKSINSERVCLTAPAIYDASYKIDYSPLFLAIMLASSESLSSNLAGEKISSPLFIEQTLSEAEVNSYLYNGVSVFESVGDSVYLIRAMTTRTLDEGGNYECTYRNICAVVAADMVKQSLTTLLTKQISSTNPVASTGVVQTIIVGELERLIERKLITSYAPPVVALDEVDTSICKISVNVGIMQSINQIYLHINMQV